MKRIALVSLSHPMHLNKFIPKGLIYLATILDNNNFNTRVYTRNILRLPIRGYINKILEYKPDAIGISITESTSVKNTIKYIDIIKKKSPEIKIIVGGPHVTATNGEMLKYSRTDFAFYGEAEYSLLEFMKKYPYIENIRGLIYRKKNKIIVNPPPKMVEDLDKLPFPNYDLIHGLKEVLKKQINFEINYISVGRGCPYSCNFCYVPMMYGRKMRFRSPKSIVDEVEYNLKLFNKKHIHFGASTFTCNRGWAIKLCDEIIKRKLNISWTILTRADLLDLQLLKLFKKAGCRTITLGIESNSQKVLNYLNKKIDQSQYLRMLQLVKKHNITPLCFIMIGNMGENITDVIQSISLMNKADVPYILDMTRAYPGTKLYEEAVKKKLVKKRWYLTNRYGTIKVGLFKTIVIYSLFHYHWILRYIRSYIKYRSFLNPY